MMKLKQQVSKQEEPKIEFPCAHYSLKIVGLKTPDYKDFVVACVQGLASGVDLTKVQAIDSKNGTFQSVRLSVTAQSEEHLKLIHTTLMNSGKVKLVL
ncbi:MAG: DUF493 domain-containing protein [Oceanospirillaceae bacterium]|nr:DUF493 domain-containing protein [Oceanospirillaceae bacterium]